MVPFILGPQRLSQKLTVFRKLIHFLLLFLPGPTKPADSLRSNAILLNHELGRKRIKHLRDGSLSFTRRRQQSSKDKSTETHTMVNPFISQNSSLPLDIPVMRHCTCPYAPNPVDLSEHCPPPSPSEVQEKPPNLGQVFWLQIVTQFLLAGPHVTALLHGRGKSLRLAAGL